MTQLVKHAPPQQLQLRETPKHSVNIASRFAIYNEDIVGWCTVCQLCHTVSLDMHLRLDTKADIIKHLTAVELIICVTERCL
jgi:hypothetical protein